MKCPNCNQSDEVIRIRDNVFECERCKIEFWTEKDDRIMEANGIQYEQEATNAD